MRLRRLTALVTAASLTAMVTGSAGAATVDRTLDDVDVIHTLTAPGSTQFGWAVAELADITGDGVLELIVADDAGGPAGTGRAFVFNGATGAELLALDEGPGGRFGYAIADAGDVNGDGTHDIVVGRPGVHLAYVYSGVDGSRLLTLVGTGDDRLGVAVASAGDVNADGRADLLVGAQEADVNGVDSGRAYVFSGADGSVHHALDGSVAGDLFGTGTDWVPDIDGDGVPEHVVGARDAGKWDDGGVWLFSGRTGTQLWRFDAPKSGHDLGSFFVAGLDDLTGDGVPDVYAGDYAATTASHLSGRAHVLSGVDGTVARTIDGDSPFDGLGPGREAGDLDGDGVQDLVIGSWSSHDGARSGGRFDIFSGDDGSPLASGVVGTVPGAALGFDAVGIGDVDFDGVPDVAVAAAPANVVYVVSGASLLP